MDGFLWVWVYLRGDTEHPEMFAKVGYCAPTGLALLGGVRTQGGALG